MAGKNSQEIEGGRTKKRLADPQLHLPPEGSPHSGKKGVPISWGKKLKSRVFYQEGNVVSQTATESRKAYKDRDSKKKKKRSNA